MSLLVSAPGTLHVQQVFQRVTCSQQTRACHGGGLLGYHGGDAMGVQEAGTVGRAVCRGCSGLRACGGGFAGPDGHDLIWAVGVCGKGGRAMCGCLMIWLLLCDAGVRSGRAHPGLIQHIQVLPLYLHAATCLLALVAQATGGLQVNVHREHMPHAHLQGNVD
jgi:hypothetical protein